MIQIHRCRADDVSHVAHTVFQQPQHTAQRGLIGEVFVETRAIEVFVLNGSGGVQHGDQLTAVVDAVFNHCRLTRDRHLFR